MVQETQMITFKQYLEENRKATALAALAITGAAMAAPPKPEATQAMVDYIKQKEGFRPVAEPDKDAEGNPPVVGYGTTHTYPDTKKPIKVGEKITPEKAVEYVKSSLSTMTPQLEKIPGWDDMDAGKQAALMSFGYNLGPGFYGAENFETITSKLKNKQWDEVPSALNLYNKSGGKVLRGLVTRRAEEGKLWSEGLPQSDTAKQKPVTPPTKTVTSPQPTVQPDSYEVKSGDNLSKIAKQYGKTVDEIVKMNPDIKDPNRIKPGQKIKTK